MFALDPEKAHDLTLANLEFISRRPWLISKLEFVYGRNVPELPVSCMGIDFKHPVGLAAGLDKDARAFSAFTALGFSAVELGTVTPQPQPGNDKPRLFRLIEDQGIINRMGFNSAGAEVFVKNLKQDRNRYRDQSRGVVGINIGKNAATPIEQAYRDYVPALKRVYKHADYLTVNISSPNTKSLRDLQNEQYLNDLLERIKKAHARCFKEHNKRVPIALKVAPDLTPEEIEVISRLVIEHEFDALIATNTTIARPESLNSKYASESGGLSGAPVRDLSTACIREFYRHLQGKVQIIGVGGIKNADDAWQKMIAGADYLQIYSMFIYQGPGMIAEIVRGLAVLVREHGFYDLESAMNALRTAQ